MREKEIVFVSGVVRRGVHVCGPASEWRPLALGGRRVLLGNDQWQRSSQSTRPVQGVHMSRVFARSVLVLVLCI